MVVGDLPVVAQAEGAAARVGDGVVLELGLGLGLGLGLELGRALDSGPRYKDGIQRLEAESPPRREETQPMPVSSAQASKRFDRASQEGHNFP